LFFTAAGVKVTASGISIFTDVTEVFAASIREHSRQNSYFFATFACFATR
jgi:hypothetical protein